MSRNNIKEQLESCINSISDDFVCVVNNYAQSRIVDLIRSFDSELSYDCFIEILCKNGLFDVFRRSQYSFNRLFDEHNKQISALNEMQGY